MLNRPFARYLLAAAAVAVALALRHALVSALHAELPTYITFYPAVMLAAVLGGVGPGLTATVLSALAVDYFVLPPTGSFVIETAADAIGLALFCLMGVFMSVVAERYRRNRERAAAAEKELALQRGKAALAESERRWVTTLRSIGDAVIAVDASANITFMNEPAQALTGWSEAEARGKPAGEIFRLAHEQTGEPMESPIARAMRLNQVVEAANQAVVVARGGSRIPVEDSAAPIRDEAGKLTGVVLVFRDVTERRARRREREQMLQAAQRQAELQRLSFDAIIVWRLQGGAPGEPASGSPGQGIESWNLGAEQLYGYSEREALGRVTHELLQSVHPKPWPELEPELRANGFWEGEIRHRTKDGREVIVWARKRLLRGDDGVERVLEANRDITERKRAEEEAKRLLAAVQEERDRLSALINSVYDEIWFADAEKRFTLANPAALREFGYDSTAGVDVEKLAESLEVFRPDGSPRPVEEAPPLRALRGEVVKDQDEVVRTPATGELRHRQVSAAPVKDATGKIIGSVSVVRDITERKRAEEALRQSEVRYHNLFNTMGEGFCVIEMIFDAEGRPADYRFLEVNAAFESQTGLHEAEGKLMRDLAPAHEAHWFEIYGKVALTGDPAHFVNQAKELNRWYNVHAYRVGEPELRQVAIVFSDITDIKRAEAALRESEERLRLAQQAAKIGAFEWNLQTGVNVWTPELEAMYGLARGEFGKTQPAWEQLVHPEDRAAALGGVNQTLETGEPVEGEWRVVWRDGSVHWIVGRFQAFKDAVGKPLRLSGVNMDITNRKQMEAALRESEERWVTTLRSIGDAVISTCAQGKIMFMNDVAQALTGWTLAEAHGKDLESVFNIVNEVTREKTENPLSKVLRLGQIVGLANHTALVSRDGTEYPIEDSAAPIRNQDGTITGVVLVFHDVTEKRKAEQVLRQSERLATTGRLAATLAHEIHNPLDTVGNLLFLISQVPDLETARQYAALGSEEVARVTQMTRHMLAFQRESSQPLPVNIAEVLNGVVVLFERKIAASKLQIEKQVDFDQEFLGLTSEIRQILVNLFGNAVEAVGQNGKIRLRAHACHNWHSGQRGLRVTVADNGPGIPANVRARIFEPFFTTKGEAGTGLGLWITSGIVEKYGGTLRLRSVTRPGRSGTSFSVFLPIER